jgi:hypothetical protein
VLFHPTSAAGTGTQQLVWKVESGRGDVVVMNADGSAQVAVRADAGATVRALRWIGVGLLVGGLVLLVVGTVLIVVPVVGASRRPAPDGEGTALTRSGRCVLSVPPVGVDVGVGSSAAVFMISWVPEGTRTLPTWTVSVEFGLDHAARVPGNRGRPHETVDTVTPKPQRSVSGMVGVSSRWF